MITLHIAAGLPCVADTGDLPEWLHLVPMGAWDGHPTGRRFTVGPSEVAEIVSNFSARGIDLVVDFEHATVTAMQRGHEAPAAAWISQVEARADGVWGRVREYTQRGRARLEAREYRYLSPVLSMNAQDPRSGRPVGIWLSSVALTNVPFFAGALRPVVNSGVVAMDLLALLIPLLGLPADATPEAAVDAVKALKDMTPGQPDATMTARASLGEVVCTTMQWTNIPQDAGEQLARLTRHEGYVPEAEVMTLRQQLEAAQVAARSGTVDQLVARGLDAGKITPALRDNFRAFAARDFEGARNWLDAAPVIVPRGTQVAARASGGDVTSALSATELAACKALRLTPEEYIVARDAGSQA